MSTRPWMETTTWRMLELAGDQTSGPSPSKVPSRLRHTVPDSSRLGFTYAGAEGEVAHLRRRGGVRRRQLQVEEEEAVLVWRPRGAHHCRPEEVHAVLECPNVDSF